jgi:hypothetical protein
MGEKSEPRGSPMLGCQGEGDPAKDTGEWGRLNGQNVLEDKWRKCLGKLIGRRWSNCEVLLMILGKV